jgi:hypothetical protein
MRNICVPILALILIGFTVVSCKKDQDTVDPKVEESKSKPTASFESDFAFNWLNLHFELIKTTPGFVPPVAARTLGYSSWALYESVVYGMSGYQSLSDQINGMKSLPKPDTTLEYNWALAASTSQFTILREFFLTTSDKNKNGIDSLRKYYETRLKVGSTDEVIDRSIRYGAAVATAIFEYSKTDGGQDGHVRNFPSDYVLPSGIGSWRPTGIQRIPLLPNWGNNRTLVKSNMQDYLAPPVKFSFEKSSGFFAQAKEVFDISKTLTEDQKAIALFFADGNGTLTPPGHHFNVAKIILETEKAKLNKVAEVFVKTGLALNDAFVGCWRGKYLYNLMRPSTYIKQTIDRNWTPFLADPPFPDYASGHSTAAGVLVEVLESFYGKNYAFEDDTHAKRLPNRKFKSINEYGMETSNSRVYGGIHYDFSCVKGYESGKKIGQNVLKLKYKK